MPKINHEEYGILKSLDNKWKWIARDKDRGLYAFTEKPVRKYAPSPYWDTETERPYTALELIDETHLFHFIQWEDEEPYNIAELIEEYEDSKEYKDSLAIEYFMDKAKEGEETEVKNIEWVKKEIGELPCVDTAFNSDGSSYIDSAVPVMAVYDLLDQLDEPETLSEYWIEQKSIDTHVDTLSGEVQMTFRLDDLENLLVPDMEEVDRAYKDGYEEGREHGFYKGYREGLGNKGGEPETVADVVTDFYKSLERLKEVLGTEVEEMEE